VTYGYRGWRLIVFIFFGLVSTLGVNFFSKQIDGLLVLTSYYYWFVSVGVLNLIMLRDEDSDRAKNTIVVK
jgi:1,4-dihydroxy-2-naphthoate octaprenyltransferase